MKPVAALLAEIRNGTSLKGELLRGGFWSLAVKLASTLTALLTAVVLARVLGVEGYGIYSFVLALVSILAIPAQLGLPNLVVRETARAQVAERWDVTKGLWRWATLTGLMMSLVLMAASGAMAWVFKDQLGNVYLLTLWWGLLLIPLITLGNLRGAALRGLRKMVQGQVPESVVRPIMLVVLTILVTAWSTHSLTAADIMALHVLASLFAFILGVFWLAKAARPGKGVKMQLRENRRPWLTSSLTLGLVGGVLVLNQNAGVLALGFLGSEEDVALFRVAYQAAAFVGFGISVANVLSMPYITQLHRENRLEDLRRMTVTLSRACTILSLSIFVVLLLVGKPLIVLLFGVIYADSYMPLLILSAGQVVTSAFANGATVLAMTGREGTLLRGHVAGMVVTVCSIAILSGTFGVAGVALASSIGLVASYFWQSRAVARFLGFDTSAIGIRPHASNT